MERKHKISLEFADDRTLTIVTKHQVKLVLEPLPTIEGFHVRIKTNVEKSELEKNFAEGFPIKPEDKLRFTEVKNEM